HIGRAAVAELHVNEGHTYVESIAAGEQVYFGLGIRVAPVSSIDDRGDPETIQAVDGVDQRAHLFVESRLRDHGLQGDEGERVAMDDARMVSMVIQFELRARQLWKPLGTHAEYFHRLLVHEGAVVGVLNDQGAVWHGLTQFARGGEAIFLELVGGPASYHLDPVSLGRSFGLLA